MFVIKKIVSSDEVENQKDRVILQNDEISIHFLFTVFKNY